MQVMEMYQPGAIVMCCGADSLSGDKLGCFNLSMEGHSNCIEFLQKWVARPPAACAVWCGCFNFPWSDIAVA